MDEDLNARVRGAQASLRRILEQPEKKKAPVIRGKYDKESVGRIREHLTERLETLNEYKNDRCRTNEESYTAYKEYEALTWLADDNPDRGQEQEFVYLFISSAMRDPYAFPNAGQFKIQLASEVDNIIKAELVQASIPLVDPTINTANYIVRYSFPPHTGAGVVQEIMVPVGSYLGQNLAPELTRQLNQSLFPAQLLANTYIIEDETGVVLDAGTGNPPVGVNQFYVTWNESSQRITFQMIDDQRLPTNAQVFAIHVQPRPDGAQTPYRFLNDDLYEVLGFNRIDFEERASTLSQYDATTDTYYLRNTDTDTLFNGLFGVGTSVDSRYRYSVHSNQAVDLRGNIAVVLDIDPLNDNDIAGVTDSAGTGALTLSDYFGFILLRDPAAVTDRMAEITNNSYPIRKYYREGRSRVGSLNVTMRRPDGTIFNFGGVDFYLTIRLTVTRTQPPKPMFTRGT